MSCQLVMTLTEDDVVIRMNNDTENEINLILIKKIYDFIYFGVQTNDSIHFQ